jgi:L-asparagine transporter-like permease
MAESAKASPEALQVLKAISDQFDIIKKQQWVTTNYAVLIYAAIAWLSYHVRGSQAFSCALVTVAIIVRLVASTLLIWFQFDLGELRQRGHR